MSGSAEPGFGSVSRGWVAAGSADWGSAVGKSEAETVALIHQALDLGVNLVDTAAA